MYLEDLIQINKQKTPAYLKRTSCNSYSLSHFQRSFGLDFRKHPVGNLFLFSSIRSPENREQFPTVSYGRDILRTVPLNYLGGVLFETIRHSIYKKKTCIFILCGHVCASLCVYHVPKGALRGLKRISTSMELSYR